MSANRLRTRTGSARLLLIVALLSTGAPVAQTIDPEPLKPPDSSVPAGDITPAPLIVANRQVFIFRAAPDGVPPYARASASVDRIHAVLDRGGSTEVGSREIPDGFLVTIGGEGVFRVLRKDIEPESEDTLESLASEAVSNLRLVVAEQSELNDIPRLLRTIAWGVLATLVFLAALWLLAAPARWISNLLERATLKGADKIHLGGFTGQHADKVAAFLGRTSAVFKWSLWLVAGYIWLGVVLQLFPYTRPWGEQLGVYLRSMMGTIAIAIVEATPGLALVAVIFVVTRYVTKAVDLFFRAVERETVEVDWVHADTAEATRRILIVVLWLFALAISYPYLPGSSSGAFKGVSVFAGLMISLGSTTVIGQILSGFILIYSRTFRVGDFVRIGETEGVIKGIGLFATRVENMRRERVSIPNAIVVGTEVKNYTRPAGELGVILSTAVTIGYRAPWRQVHAMLVAAANRTPGLLKSPPPFVIQTALSDFNVEYQICAYLEQAETRVRTRAALHANIQDVFNEHGVQIMSPHYESDPAAPIVVPRESWFNPPALND